MKILIHTIAIGLLLSGGPLDAQADGSATVTDGSQAISAEIEGPTTTKYMDNRVDVTFTNRGAVPLYLFVLIERDQNASSPLNSRGTVLDPGESHSLYAGNATGTIWYQATSPENRRKAIVSRRDVITYLEALPADVDLEGLRYIAGARRYTVDYYRNQSD